MLSGLGHKEASGPCKICFRLSLILFACELYLILTATGTLK